MPSFSFNLITINGKFHSEKSVVRSRLWSTSRKELQKVFPGGKEINNFIKLKFNCGVTCQIFRRGGFKITVSKNNCIEIIRNIKQIVNQIRCDHAKLLFENKLISSTFRITQVHMSIRCIEEKTEKLSFEKVVNHFPANYVKNKLKIPYKNCVFYLVLDHAQHESGSSHLDFNIEIENKDVALCKIFTNFKVVVLLPYTAYLNEIFQLVSEFCGELYQICSAH